MTFMTAVVTCRNSVSSVWERPLTSASSELSTSSVASRKARNTASSGTPCWARRRPVVRATASSSSGGRSTPARDSRIARRFSCTDAVRISSGTAPIAWYIGSCATICPTMRRLSSGTWLSMRWATAVKAVRESADMCRESSEGFPLREQPMAVGLRTRRLN